jgi:hypothetical protein
MSTHRITMVINENKLKNLIKEAIQEQMLTEAQTLIDNFDVWGDLLNCTDPDQFYFIQIIKRYKDNKGMSKAGNYHAGGEYGEYSNGTAFKVRNKADLMALKPKIIQYCDANNARAYITSNPRSDSAINAFMPTYRRRSGNNTNDPRYIHAAEILAGQAKHDPVNFPERKRMMLDVDTSDKRVWRVAKAIIKSYGIPIEAVFGTPSGGLHIMLPDSYAKEIPDLISDLRVFDAEYNRHTNQRDFFPDKGFQQTVHANFDGKFILYSNVQTAGY